MSEEEIFNKIKDMIADNFDVDKDKITEDTNFMKIKTIGDAVSYIKAHQG